MNSNTRENTVGFVGLGDMGGPMVANLLKAGHARVGHGLDKAQVDRGGVAPRAW